MTKSANCILDEGVRQRSAGSLRRVLTAVALGLGLLSGWPALAGAEPIKVPMTPDRWRTFGEAEFKEHKGEQALVLTKGSATLNGLTFRDGTIEFDVEPTAMGAGLGFRMRDEQTFEDFYLRPKADCATSSDCIQYAPFTRGVLLWDLYPQYQASAPLRPGEWNRLKLVISGRRMNVFVNGGKSPALEVSRLEGDALEGGLLLTGPGHFANLAVTPNAVEGLASEPLKDPTADDARFLRHWQIAPPAALPAGKQPDPADLANTSTAWRTVVAERGGLVNISRLFGYHARPPARGVTWLKTTITSDESRTKRTAIGWSREVWVFVNGRLVYEDKNLYQPPAARKAPNGRCSVENGSFVLPLNAGENEVVIAVANDFYGWGLIMRLDDLEGVHLARR